MNSRYVLAIDPSGSFKEGQGTTGWCLYDLETKKIAKFGYIHAANFNSQLEYWDDHITLIDALAGFKPDIVLEDYLLYGDRATSQINSRLETPQLLGVIKYECYKRDLKVAIQTAMQVKTRWADSILVKKNILQFENNRYKLNGRVISDHVRDSIRHAIHFATYTSKYNKGGY